MGEILLRTADLDDAEQVREIYNHYVVRTTATFDLVARTAEEQREWLRTRRGAFAAVVAVEGESILGFASISPYKQRAAYRTTVEDSVYVRPDALGRGVGRRLLDHVVDVARASGFHSVIARIEAGGAASRALHAACGFELVGIEREVGRKFNRWLSVAVMQNLLGDR